MLPCHLNILEQLYRLSSLCHSLETSTVLSYPLCLQRDPKSRHFHDWPGRSPFAYVIINTPFGMCLNFTRSSTIHSRTFWVENRQAESIESDKMKRRAVLHSLLVLRVVCQMDYSTSLSLRNHHMPLAYLKHETGCDLGLGDMAIVEPIEKGTFFTSVWLPSVFFRGGGKTSFAVRSMHSVSIG